MSNSKITKLGVCEVVGIIFGPPRHLTCVIMVMNTGATSGLIGDHKLFYFLSHKYNLRYFIYFILHNTSTPTTPCRKILSVGTMFQMLLSY